MIKSLHNLGLCNESTWFMQREHDGSCCMNIWQQDEAPRSVDERKFGGRAKHRLPLVDEDEPCNISPMLNILSLFVGAISLFLAIFAFIPFLGWANWVIIPFAIIGLALGAMSDRTSGRNLNLVVIGVGALRLMLGGGII